jgi:hypothetical protein
VYVIDSFFILAVSSTAALFFFRVRAVYCNNIVVTWIFGFLLFALSALTFTAPFVAKTEHIGTTKRCALISFETYCSTAIQLISCIFDTLVFVAISLRVVSCSIVGDTFGARIKSFFGGVGLPALSRSILQGGQLYYSFVTGCFWLPM